MATTETTDRLNYYHEAVSAVAQAMRDGDAFRIEQVANETAGWMNSEEERLALGDLCHAALELIDIAQSGGF